MATTNSESNINKPEAIEVETIEAEVIDTDPITTENTDTNKKQSTEHAIIDGIFEEVTAQYYETTASYSTNSSSKDNVTATAQSTTDPITVIPNVIPHEGEQTPTSQTQKIKGAAQMAAGGALAVAGVPLLILPGPGAVFIVGGVALASKGQRNFSGRSASPLEAKLDNAAAKMTEIAKEQTKQAAQKAAKEAPNVAKNVAQQIPVVAKKAAEAAPFVAKKVADTAPVVAKKIADTAPVVAKTIGDKAPVAAKKVADAAPGVAEKVGKQAPVVAHKIAEGVSSVASTTAKAAPIFADKVAKSAPKAAEKITQTAPVVAGKVIAGAPVVAETVAKGFTKGISLGANLLKQAGTKAADINKNKQSKFQDSRTNTLHTKQHKNKS